MLYDVGAAVVNHIKGDHKTARSHWGNAAFDAGAMLIPYVPAGTSKVVKAGALGAKALDRATDAGKAVGKYSNVPNPKNVKEGGSFTRNQKKNILEQNKNQNGGVIRSDQSGEILDMPTQSKKGQKANMNQAEIDHIKPKSRGSSNSSANAQVLSKKENLKKGNKIDE